MHCPDNRLHMNLIKYIEHSILIMIDCEFVNVDEDDYMTRYNTAELDES